LGQRCSTFHDFSRVGMPNPKCLSTGSATFCFLALAYFDDMKNDFWFRIAVIALGGLPIGLMILAVYK
jgi:hypothetical protein